MADVGARLDHVGLAVADLAAEAWWFCDVFGLVPELTLRVEALDLSIEMLVHPEHRYRLELLHRPGSAADRKPGTPGEAALHEGYGHVAFDVADLDAAYDRAVARGADGVRGRPGGQPRRAAAPAGAWQMTGWPGLLPGSGGLLAGHALGGRG